MDDKLFDLIEKMYSDLKSDIKSVENHVTKIELSIEQEIKPDINALLDGYKQLAEGQNEIKGQLQELKAKVDSQDIQISVIKGGL